jgi:hypothetical protein
MEIRRMPATVAEGERVVAAFVRAMNEWERGAWAARRLVRGTAMPESYYPGATASLERLFAEYCTPRERPHGRLGSFQHPPEYDPKSERVVGSRIEGRRAIVETERESGLGAGRLRYSLQPHGERWLIDNLRQLVGDKWQRATL